MEKIKRRDVRHRPSGRAKIYGIVNRDPLLYKCVALGKTDALTMRGYLKSLLEVLIHG